MAYAAVVTVRELDAGVFEIKIAETDVDPTSEATIPGLPPIGTCRRQECILVSGAGTTVDPILGTVTNPAGTTSVVVENETPGAVIDNAGAATYATANGGTTLYHRSRPDAGADNVVNSTYHIQQSW